MVFNQEFLGTGWSFPPKFKKIRSDVQMSSDIIDIEESLHILITTRRGERLMRPDFGCDLSDLLFESIDSTRIHMAKKRIEEAILIYEPRVDLKQVNLDISNVLEGKLLISVDYIVRATNTRRNIVFPYYLTEATDI